MNPSQPLTPEQEAEIIELAQSQRLIEAIKRYRELTNASLAEAKAAVEALAAAPPKLGAEPKPQRALGQPTIEVEILDMLRMGGAELKIPAIKRYRDATGVGLAEAKQAVEALGEKHGLLKKSGSPCFVATAVFENETAPAVEILRAWRDTRLIQCVSGRLFIAFYAWVGPVLAEVPRRSSLARACLKRILAWFAARLNDRALRR